MQPSQKWELAGQAYIFSLEPLRDTAPTFRGDSGVRRCITQGEAQDARQYVFLAAVASYLATFGYSLLPYHRQVCRKLRAIALFSAFDLLTYVPQRHPFVRRALGFGISDLDDGWSEARFLRQDIPALLAALRMPETLQLENRGQCRGEEAFLVMIVRLSGDTRLLGMMPKVGREYTQIFRMEKGARNFLNRTWKHLLDDNWDFLAGRLAMFNQCFIAKYKSVNNVMVVPLVHRRIAVGMDGHKRPIPRPQVYSLPQFLRPLLAHAALSVE